MDNNFNVTNMPDDVYINVSGNKSPKKITAQKGAEESAKARAIKALEASKGTVAALEDVLSPADTVVSDAPEKIMGMPKNVFYGVAGLSAIALIIGCVYLYKKYK